MRLATRLLFPLLTGLVLAATTPPRDASAQEGPCCFVPGNGQGTANHPPSCPVGYSGELFILDGMPPNSTIDMASNLASFAGLVQVPGGALGGNVETWTASLGLTMVGTGAMAGFNRFIVIPISNGQTHSAPRVPLAPVQSFNTDIFELQGQIMGGGDPDFALLRITAGTNFAYPSPGNTIFTQDGAGYTVDSFFDITYRIDFVGDPGGALAGRSGSTTGTSRFVMCHERPTYVKRSTWGAVKSFYR